MFDSNPQKVPESPGLESHEQNGTIRSDTAQEALNYTISAEGEEFSEEEASKEGEVSLFSKNSVFATFEPIRLIEGAPALDLTEALKFQYACVNFEDFAAGRERLRHHPAILSITNPDTAQGVVVLSVVDPTDEYKELTFLPRAHPLMEGLRERMTQEIVREETIGRVDKISQRGACEQIGVFLQPDYADVRFISVNFAAQELRFTKVDFSHFPTEALLDSATPIKEVIFENPLDGFIVTNTDGQISISSGNKQVLDCAEKTKRIQDPSLRLVSFLTELTKSDYEILKFSRYGESSSDANWEQILEALERHSGAVYIKSTRTAGGKMILKVDCDGKGNLNIQSDSPDYESAVRDIQARYEARIERTETIIREGREKSYPAEFIKQQAEYLERLRTEGITPKALLASLVYEMKCPTIEKEIPSERVGGQKVEFRLICQKLPQTEEFLLGGYYTKVSDGEVAANISLGGHGEKIEDIIEKIYRKCCPEAGDAVVQTMTEESVGELLEKTLVFAEQYSSIVSQGGGDELRDFAVDICPVWNYQTQRIDFYLLEVQHGYAFKGLQEVNPEAAEQVVRNKREIFKEEFLSIFQTEL